QAKLTRKEWDALRNPATERLAATPSKSMTVRDVLAQAVEIEGSNQVDPAAVRNTGNTLLRFFVDLGCADDDIRTITGEQARKLSSWAHDENYAKGTQSSIIQLSKTVWNYAISCDLADRNPFTGV